MRFTAKTSFPASPDSKSIGAPVIRSVGIGWIRSVPGNINMEIQTKSGGVRCVCDVCGKDRDHMCHEWDGVRWRDYCYLHWNYEEQSTLDKWLA